MKKCCAVLDLLRNDTSGAHSLGPLSNEEHPRLLDGFVNILAFISTIWNIIVSYIIEFMLFKEFFRDDPWTSFNNLVNPLAVSDSLSSLLSSQDSQALALMRLVIVSDAHDEIGIGKCLFGLLKLSHVSDYLHISILPSICGSSGTLECSPEMEQIEYTISIYPNSPASWRRVRLVTNRINHARL
jgi:hypothetical protein